VGTSRSTPVAVGATALIYQAYRQSHPGALPASFGGEFCGQAKQYLKSSATDLGYDSFAQGSGSVDAFQAAKAAAGAAPSVSPSDWRAGNYRGQKFEVFPRVLSPGGSDSQTFTVANPGSGSLSVSDRTLQKVATESFDFQSGSVKSEPVPNFNAPDYLMDITDRIKAHADADLVVIRANYPHAQFDGDENYESDQAWRLLAYNWTDINHDRRLWTDRDQDGIVDHADLDTSSNIDGSTTSTSSLRDGEGRVRPVLLPPAGRERPHGLHRHPAQRDGRRHLPRLPALDAQRAIDRPTSSRDRLLQERRLELADDDAVAGRPVHGDAERAGGHAVRHVRRRGRRVERRDASVVPVAVTVAATSAAGRVGNITGNLTFGGRRSRQQSDRSTTTGRSSAPTTGRGARSRATGGSSTTTSRRRRRPGRCSSPTRRGRTHPDRPRHAADRAGRRTSTS
jgi:hypothetical protein